MLGDLASSRLLRRAIVAAVLVEHLLFVARPLNVLAPVDPWRIGHLVLTGHIPYRDFAFEYPPLAIVAFLLPGAVPHAWSLSVLAAQSAVLDLAVVVTLHRSKHRAVLPYLVLSLGLFPFLSGGFDAVAVLTITVGTALLAAGASSGWWTSAVGALVKLSPAGAWVWARRPIRAGLVALSVTVAVAVAPLLVARHATDSYIGYNLRRGVQIESVAGSATWAAERVSGRRPRFAYRFRSWEIAGASTVATAVSLAGGMALIAVAVAMGRRGPVDGEGAWEASLTVIVVVMASFKVLSPQYVVWAAPLAAAVGGRALRLFAVVAFLTTATYVVGGSSDSFMAVVVLRDIALVALAAHQVTVVLRASRSAPPAASGSTPMPV